MAGAGKAADSEKLEGLGGWLIIVLIGLSLALIRSIHGLWNTYWPLSQSGRWELLTDPASKLYHPRWEPLLIFEISASAVTVVAVAALVVLFFQRSRYFPIGYQFFLLGSFFVLLIDPWLASPILPDQPVYDGEATREIGRSAIGCVIWVAYMNVSRRVDLTFVR